MGRKTNSLIPRFSRATPHEDLRSLERQLTVSPDNAFLWSKLAETHLALATGKLEAKKSFSLFLSADLNTSNLDSAQAWAAYGVLMEENGLNPEAERAYRTATEIDPSYRWALGKLSHFLRKHTDNIWESKALALRCVEIDPDNAWSWFNLGYIYDQHLEDYEAAVDAYGRALMIDPRSVVVWENLAVVLAFNTTRVDETRHAFSRAFHLQSRSARTWTAFGYYLTAKGQQLDQAEQAFREALLLDASDWAACLGLAYLNSIDPNKQQIAEQYYFKAIELGAPSTDVRYQMALLPQRRRRFTVVK